MLSTGCLSRQPGEQQEVAPDTTQTEAARGPRCEASPARAIALLRPPPEAGACGLALERDGEGERQLLVRPVPREGEPEPSPIARGVAPEACGSALEFCELWGVSDALGPIVLASVRGHESEMPIQVYVGWAAGDRLVFAQSWYGLSSVMDHTRIGPPWVLAPFDCGGELMLLPTGRLPESKVELADADLVALAGQWAVGEDGLSAPPATAATTDPSTCRAILPALP
ncbi:hypothetical protein DB30_03425 [Enhygromyxa salina]|uniref:Uncharacterized protein n=1 Tax=Enhygromyxa salina TaxID=215803 RepID=A0A0C2A1W7_9BACT|nr:hypothetical protein [Enhygromyxa salina]KIG17368.1 hypothetical protein DB30_03425 [Enhygromyxa salina]